MTAGASFLMGGLLTVVGLVLTIPNIKNFRRRQRILAMPTSRIGQASGNGDVEIKGRIVPSELGLVRTPFSDRSAVWYRVTVREYRSSYGRRGGSWQKVLTEIDGRPFMVDDGSGQKARVLPLGATVILDEQNVASSGTLRDPPPHVESFLRSRGLESTSWLGFNKSMRYEEEVLAPGEHLFALGPSRRDPGPPVQDGYRAVPGTELVMFHDLDLDGELILTNKTEEQLTRRLLLHFVAGLVVCAMGLLLSLFSVARAMMR